MFRIFTRAVPLKLNGSVSAAASLWFLMIVWSIPAPTKSMSAAKITSSEGANRPVLVVGGTTAPPPPSTSTGSFTISPVAGGPYQAVSGSIAYTWCSCTGARGSPRRSTSRPTSRRTRPMSLR
jgi:hypothetical protein